MMSKKSSTTATRLSEESTPDTLSTHWKQTKKNKRGCYSLLFVLQLFQDKKINWLLTQSERRHLSHRKWARRARETTRENNHRSHNHIYIYIYIVNWIFLYYIKLRVNYTFLNNKLSLLYRIYKVKNLKNTLLWPLKDKRTIKMF